MLKVGDRAKFVGKPEFWPHGDVVVTEVHVGLRLPYRAGNEKNEGLFKDVELELIPEKPKSKSNLNPKDLLGSKKISITKFPTSALIHGAHAMMNGADKYGPFNWRSNDVIASIYVDAAFRHLASWFEREEIADDSGVHHLGHALATIAILLDAQENGNLIDDRPPASQKEVIKQLLDRLAEAIKKKREEKK